MECSFRVLRGRMLTRVEARNNEFIEFETTDGCIFTMQHYQECCESVVLEDVCGDFQDIIGSVVVNAEEVGGGRGNTNIFSQFNYTPPQEEYDGSETWTFYKIDTNKGGVTLRWHGSSNGYYSESVEFELTHYKGKDLSAYGRKFLTDMLEVNPLEMAVRTAADPRKPKKRKEYD